MTHWLLILATAIGPGEVEQSGVRVKTVIESNRYEWHVTNVDAAPIMRFEIPVQNMYAPVAPEGWATDLPKKGDRFEAWTDDPQRAIRRGQTREFGATVTVQEASLGHVTVELVTDDGDTILLEEAWGATPMPRTMAYLVGAVILVIALLQWVIARRAAAHSTG